MKPPPPRLPAAGCVTASANATAIAASTALPPRFMISTPTCDAILFVEATIPCFARTGSCEAACAMGNATSANHLTPGTATLATVKVAIKNRRAIVCVVLFFMTSKFAMRRQTEAGDSALSVSWLSDICWLANQKTQNFRTRSTSHEVPMRRESNVRWPTNSEPGAVATGFVLVKSPTSNGPQIQNPER